MKDLKILWELQELGALKEKTQKPLKTLPEVKQLKSLRTEIETIQADMRILMEDLNLAKKNLKLLEDNVFVLKEKMVKASNDLYSGEITDSKELESAQKNVLVLKDKVSENEELALTAMEKIEKTDEEIKEMATKLDNRKDAFRLLNREYNDKRDNIIKKEEKLDAKIGILIKRVNPDKLKLYNNIAEKFEDKKAIALLQTGVCSGCHMAVSFELLKLSRNKPDKIVCDNCGRILLNE